MRASQSPTNLKRKKYNANPHLTFPHIFVYEASAGSGKTRRLASRYVDFLLYYSYKTPLPFNFRNVLAVTFTNEAADQMRQEILKMLKTKAFLKSKDSFATLKITDEIIRNFSDFAVRTIDSFVHNLLVASSLELKLPPDYEIIPQLRPYLEYVLDNLLEEVLYNQGIAQLFLEFLNHFLVVEGQRHWNPKRTLLGVLEKFYQEENRRAKRFIDTSKEIDLGQTERQLKNQLKQFLSSLVAQPDLSQRFIKTAQSSLSSSGPNFLIALNRFINRPLIPGEGILNKNAPQPDLNIIQAWQALSKDYNDYAHTFVWLRYSFYLKVFSIFRQRLEELKGEKRIVFLEELNSKARQFLASEGLLPAEIYYRLAAVLHHYMIDEFQDTSLLQWENIQALVEDALSKGGSLFCVGDKKQAIYRFRGGEVGLFDSIKQRFKNQVNKIYDEVLPWNYRSRDAIVKFNNSVFSKQNLSIFLDGLPYLTGEFKERILTVFKDSQQKQGGVDAQAGYVKLEIVEGENIRQLQELLNTKLKETIEKLRQRFNYQDILILVRDNQEAELVASFLLSQGYPVCAGRTISIRQNFLILQIISLLKFLNSPIDNLCFANFILGDIFSKSTGLGNQRVRSWLENQRFNEKEGVLYTEFRSAFPDIWEKFLHYLFNAVGYLAVYDLVETILIMFKIENNFPHLTGFTQRLLEILNELQEQGRNSLSDFLEWFDNVAEEELFVQLPAGLDAIKILTIHKAKGLTQSVVVLPYAALEIKIGDGAKIVHEVPEGLYLLYFQKDIYENHPKLSSIYQREYFLSLLDELNCLYVGFTRAACELYIFIPQKINRSNNSLITLLFGKEYNSSFKEFGRRLKYSSKSRRPTKESTKTIRPSRILPQEVFKNILKDQLINPGEVISPDKRYSVNRGELIHYLLTEINPVSFLENPYSFEQMIRDACRLFNYSYSQDIIHYLSEFFREPKMQDFFNPRYRGLSEKELVDQYGNLRRIDRLILTQEKVLIIDFKTGEEFQEKHQRQIIEYANLIKDIYPHRLIEARLVYVDTKKIRRVNV